MQAPAFRPGFRFSAIDATVIALAIAAGFAAANYSTDLVVMAAVVVVHFFLFCNVFRVARKPELCWATVFLACAALHVLTSGSIWPALLAVVLATTALVIWRATCKASYHGVLWRRLNPDLPQWWQRQHGPPAAGDRRRAP